LLPYTVCFGKKKRNVAGLQVADLAAPGIVDFAQNPTSTRLDWLAVKPRMRKKWTGTILGYGLKTFP
jgi:hypothetical protein